MLAIPAIYGYKANNTTTEYTGVQASGEPEDAQAFQNGSVAEQKIPNEAEQQDKITFSDNSKTQDVGNKAENSTSKPKDSSSELTQRLVAALGQFEVRQVIADANKELISLRVMSAVGKGENAALAGAYVKKLEKLVNRADRKIKDLDKEDMHKLQQARLEQQKQKARAEEIKAELRRKQIERMARERGYLLDSFQEDVSGASGSAYNTAGAADTATEAAITAQAQAMAAAETAAASVGSADGEASFDAPAGAAATADSVPAEAEAVADASA